MAKSPFGDKMNAPFEIPHEMREVAEKSLAQAREGVSRAIAAANEAVETMEQKAGEAQKQAKDFGRRGLAFTEQSIAAAFDLAEKIMKSNRIDEVLQHQAEYMKTQFEGLREHLQESGAEIQRRAKEAAEEMASEGAKMRDKARQAMEEGAEALKKATTPKAGPKA